MDKPIYEQSFEVYFQATVYNHMRDGDAHPHNLLSMEESAKLRALMTYSEVVAQAEADGKVLPPDVAKWFKDFKAGKIKASDIVPALKHVNERQSH